MDIFQNIFSFCWKPPVLSCRNAADRSLRCGTELVHEVKSSGFFRSLLPAFSLHVAQAGYLLVLSAFKHLLIEAALVYIKGQELWYVTINK